MRETGEYGTLRGMDVTLTQDLEAFIEARVRSGRYLDASEVVREALRELEQREDEGSPALEAVLLEGVRGEHRAYDTGTLERVRRMAGQL